ncbi:MAG: cardiolipin synthase [Treponema sp.]|jgi:cardiolipin synthase|nr:cardiolipin synthase [Treponema sp.]
MSVIESLWIRNKKKKWIRLIFRRRVFVSFLLLIQIAFILALTAGSSLTFRYASFALSWMSVVVSLYIINKKEKPAYKVTWVFLILTFPIFGGILYIVFHFASDFKKLKALFIKRKEESKFFLPMNNELVDMEADCLSQIRYLQNYAGFPVYTRTQAQYFADGQAFFQKVLVELEKAERYIFLEFFIMRRGLMLDSIIDLLEKKAAQGLDVRIVYDDLGCFFSLPTDYKHSLEDRGIQCVVFNPFKPALSSLQNNRDHRKLIIIDGKTAFTGGLNLADEYINKLERFGHWKDAAIMIQGDAVWSLTILFLQIWNLERIQDDFAVFYPWKDGERRSPSDGYIQPYGDSPFDDDNVGEHVYLQIINNAKEYVYINTPYLVVDDNMLSALMLSAKSGVDVRIITPHHWDKEVAAITSRSYYRQLVSAGVKIYEYTNGFNHSKTFVSDDRIATVGTANLDFRSLYLHFECGVCLYQNSAVEDIRKDFLETLAVSRKITLKDCSRNAFQRVIQDVLRVFAPLM